MNNEMCVPASALEVSGGGEMEGGGGAVSPDVGDEVEFTVRGAVTRSEGGNVYVKAASINGSPVPNETMDGGMQEDAAMDAEMAGYRKQGGGMGNAAGALLALLLLGVLWLWPASAKDVEFARARYCTGGAVSNHVAVTNLTQGYSVSVNNLSASTVYLLVFDSVTNMVAGDVPHFTALPVPTASLGYHEWGPSGAPFERGITVCLSTTPFSLTNASSGGTVTVIHSGGVR
jgi:hypothetical protein